jgi:Cu2+-exporting ATPase
MAVVWAVPEEKDAQDWKEQLGEKLASHLTTCGYKSNLRGKCSYSWSSIVKGLE